MMGGDNAQGFQAGEVDHGLSDGPDDVFIWSDTLQLLLQEGEALLVGDGHSGSIHDQEYRGVGSALLIETHIVQRCHTWSQKPADRCMGGICLSLTMTGHTSYQYQLNVNQDARLVFHKVHKNITLIWQLTKIMVEGNQLGYGQRVSHNELDSISARLRVNELFWLSSSLGHLGLGTVILMDSM